MKSSDALQCNGVVALLVINEIVEIPRLAITSILESSSNSVVVGYVNQRDIKDLPKSNRIEYLDLGPILDFASFSNSSTKYKAFSNMDFYKIVECKWTLIEVLLERDLDWLIYNDLDCFWIRDSTEAIVSYFASNPNSWMQIQNFTDRPDVPLLCMGYVAFRNSEKAKDFVRRAKARHALELRGEPLTGDDDVVTMLYKEEGLWNEVSLLPQSTFPVGNMLNLYHVRESFPGVKSPSPYIFHTNYVIGLENKRLMIRIFYRISKIHSGWEVSLSPRWYLLYALKKARLKINYFRVKIKFLINRFSR